MGKLIKNHWARLIVLTAAAYQLLAAIYAFFWPKFFFDFLTTNLDHAVRPVPILQIINLLCALFGLALEWPLPIFVSASTAAGLHHNRQNMNAQQHERNYSQGITTTITTSAEIAPSHLMTALAGLHGSIEARLLIYPLSALAALLLYQGTNAGLYYIIGMGVYFWAFSEGEVIMGVPWTLPRRSRRAQGHGFQKV